MTNSTNDPDLNLQSFNDHGIFTLEELNELGLSQLQLKKYHQQIVLGKDSWLLFQNHLYKLKNRKVPKIDPCGTPEFTKRKLDSPPLTKTFLLTVV